MKNISVLLADDHTVVRQGLRSLLSAEPDIEVVGEAANGRVAIQMTQRLSPDIVVMDIAMPLLNGLEAARQIIREGLPTKLLMLSSYADDEYVQQLAEIGASGYLLKQTAATDLIKAIREARRGNAFFSPLISKRLVDYCRSSRPDVSHGVELTSREHEVLQLAAEGNANKQIASILNISIKTVEKHRQKLMNKLNIHEVAGLTRYAIAHGVVENAIRVREAAVDSIGDSGVDGAAEESGVRNEDPSSRWPAPGDRGPGELPVLSPATPARRNLLRD